MKRIMFIAIFIILIIVPVVVKSYYDFDESSGESTARHEQKSDKSLSLKMMNRTKHTRQPKREIPWYILPLFNILLLCVLFGVIFFSPSNIRVSRLVFIAPLLHSEEADAIVEMANTAAGRNLQLAQEKLDRIDHSTSDIDVFEIQRYEKIIKEPKGWTKDRHQSYPTTDLNVVIHFNREEKAYISKILNARLSPLLERLYGVPQQSIRAKDMFVVRYDHDGQNKLAEHTDSSHISFNILLNDEVEGGGTSFLNRFTGETAVARPSKGDVLINNAMVSHEGLPTTKGTRYIFVGFMSIDPRDPWTGKWKNCSWFVTYLSFPWLAATLKQIFQGSIENRPNRGDTNPVYTSEYWSLGMLAEVVKFLSIVGDIFAPHKIIHLVDHEDREDYIDELDRQYILDDQYDEASWFAGQQINTRFDGLIKSEWNDRIVNSDKFREL